MRYFEFYIPYYALIKAPDEEVAVTCYSSVVADEEYPGQLFEEIKEVSRDFSLVKFSRVMSQPKFRDEYSIKDVVREFNDELNHVLIIDGSLV